MIQCKLQNRPTDVHEASWITNFDTHCSAGGIIILGGKGKIDIDNTLEARLQLLEHAAAPAVRESLFGKNPNRKYYD